MSKEIVPVSAIEKRNHCKILRSLTGVLSEHQTPRQNRWTPEREEEVPPSRVDPASNSRVNATPNSGVGVTPTTSADPTLPEAIRTGPCIHRRKTRNNTPLQSMQGPPPTSRLPTPSVAANLPTPVTDIPTIPPALRRATNNKNERHQKRVKEREKLTKILQEQLAEDKRRGINLLTPPSDDVQFIYDVQFPKGGRKFRPHVTQYDSDDETIETIPTDIDEEEEESLHQLPRRSPRLHFDQSIIVPAAGISQAALTTFMGMEYLDELSHMAGRNLDPQAIEQIANGVVHPVTKETITK